MDNLHITVSVMLIRWLLLQYTKSQDQDTKLQNKTKTRLHCKTNALN